MKFKSFLTKLDITDICLIMYLVIASEFWAIAYYTSTGFE